MLKRILLILSCAVFLICTIGTASVCSAYEDELNNMSQGLTRDIIKSGKKRVAVVDFTDLHGNITELGRFISEEISVNLTRNSTRYEVIDRAHLKSIMTEHKFAASGLVDPDTIKEIGKIAGVDLLITGLLTPFGDSIRISCKILSTKTAKVLGARKVDIAKTRSIENMLAQGIEQGAERTPKPVPAPASEPKPEPKPVAPPPAKAPETPPQKAPEVKTPETKLPEAPKSYKVIASKEEDDYLFELRHVAMSGHDIVCTVELTNKAKYWRNALFYADRSRYTKSKMTGGNGTDYDVTEIYRYDNDQHYLIREGERIMLLAGASATLQFVFKNVPSMRTIKSLGLHIYSGTRTFIVYKWRESDVVFSNLKLSRN
jgi:TolB-like protein